MLTIIIPAYNEEKVIEQTTKEYLNFFKEQVSEVEILIIPNGCTDKTVGIVNTLTKKYPHVKSVTSSVASKGNAIIEGFKHATGDIICYVDADNSTKPEMLLTLIKELDDVDCVMGSRWLKEAKILKKQPLLRRIASRGYNVLVRLMLNLQFTDTQVGGKVFKRKAIQKILPELKPYTWGFDVAILVLLKKYHFKIKEVPMTWSNDEDSKLKMRKAIPKMLKELVQIKFKK